MNNISMEQKIKLESNKSFLLFGYGLAIFPFFLLIGPLIAELFLISAIFFSFYLIIIEKKRNYYKNKFFIFFGIFYLSTLFSTLYNFYNLEDSISGIFYFRIPLFAISIWFILDNSKFFDGKIILFYSLFFSLLVFDSLIQFYLGKNLLGYEIYGNRISSFFKDEQILGGFILRSMPIFLIYLVMSEKINEKKISFFYVTLISLLCFVIFLSGERAAFGLLILFYFTIFFISKYLRKFVTYVAILFVIISIILPNLSTTKNIKPTERMFTNSLKQIIGTGQKRYEGDKKMLFNKFYIFSHQHHGHYVLSYKIFKDHVFAGTGAKGFRYLCGNKIYILENNDGCSTHPHNTYVQILTSNGLIGFSLIIFAFFFVVKEIFSCRKKILHLNEFNKYEISKAIAITAIFINLWPLIPNGSFFNNWLSMFYFYPIGFYLYFKYQIKKK